DPILGLHSELERIPGLGIGDDRLSDVGHGACRITEARSAACRSAADRCHSCRLMLFPPVLVAHNQIQRPPMTGVIHHCQSYITVHVPDAVPWKITERPR